MCSETGLSGFENHIMTGLIHVQKRGHGLLLGGANHLQTALAHRRGFKVALTVVRTQASFELYPRGGDSCNQVFLRGSLGLKITCLVL
jgi:hypothetical protein